VNLFGGDGGFHRDITISIHSPPIKIASYIYAVHLRGLNYTEDGIGEGRFRTYSQRIYSMAMADFIEISQLASTRRQLKLPATSAKSTSVDFSL
jgi:hypothetical protein